MNQRTKTMTRMALPDDSFMDTISQLPVVPALQRSGHKFVQKTKKHPLAGILLVIMMLGLVGGVGYGFVYHVFPFLIDLIQVTWTLIASGVALVVSLALAGPVIKLARRLSTAIEKLIIRNAPLDELSDMQKDYEKGLVKYVGGMDTIDATKSTLKKASTEAETLAASLKVQLERSTKRVSKIRNELQSLATKGKTPANSEEAANLQVELSEISINTNLSKQEWQQQRNQALKYANHVNTFAKLHRKMRLLRPHIEGKVRAIETSIRMIKVEMKNARVMKDATSAAAGVLKFKNKWQYDYAIEVINANVAQDLAVTKRHLNDFSRLTSDIDIDNDAIFAEMDQLSASLTGGEFDEVNMTKFDNPNYKPTEDEKSADDSGFGNLF